jgi:spore germination cell wall hydrolase CwlJ-like protein
LSSFIKTRPSARALVVACLVASACAGGVGAAYMVGSATADAGAKPVVVPIAAATRASLVNAALQRALAPEDSGLLRLASQVNPALLHAAVLQTPAPFRLANPVDTASDLNCLTAAVYYEARGESREGQAAVAQVVLNRVRSPTFPKTVCGVVYQGAVAHSCQFSFACDGQMGARHEAAAWDRAKDVAGRALGGYVMGEVGGATHFHVAALGAIWNGSMVEVARVGQHIFYGFGGHRGAIANDMVAHNSNAADVVVPAANAPVASVPVSDKPAAAPAAPTTVAVTAPAAATAATPTASTSAS